MLFRFRHRAEPDQRPISASVRFASYIHRGKPEIDQAVAGQRERRIVEGLQKRAGEHMRLAVPALARPGMQRQLMLEPRLIAQLFRDRSAPGDTLVTYCLVGYRASMMYFGARLAGLPVKIYDGSYQDWARRKLPVKSGETP